MNRKILRSLVLVKVLLVAAASRAAVPAVSESTSLISDAGNSGYAFTTPASESSLEPAAIASIGMGLAALLRRRKLN